MTAAHEGIGSLVILAFLAVVVLNVLQLKGRTITRARQVSFAAAGLLALQYVIGFSLLGGNHSVNAFHFLFALGALVTVGMEHGMANSKEDPSARARLGAIAAAGSTALVIIAYAIGMSTGS